MLVIKTNLSTRTKNCLLNAGVNDLRELSRFTEHQLLRIRHYGRTCHRELLNYLEEVGIELDNPLAEIPEPEEEEAAPEPEEQQLSPEEIREAISKMEGGNAERAYCIRADLHLPWKDVAKWVGYSSKNNCVKACKKFAYANGLDWPIPINGQVRQSGDRSKYWKKGTVGELSYRMRENGSEWAEISEKLDCLSVAELAARYAHSRGLPWPLLSEREQWEQDHAQEIWDRHVAGESFASLEKSLGKSMPIIRRIFFAFGEENGLEYIPGPSKGQLYYEMKASGATWTEVAQKYDVVYQHHCCARARDWAIQNQKPWPISKATPMVPVPGPARDFLEPQEHGQLSYDLRRDGFKWNEIGLLLGGSPELCISRASNFAASNNLPWPLRRPRNGAAKMA